LKPTARSNRPRPPNEMARAKRTQLDSKRAQVQQEIRGAGIVRDYTRISAPVLRVGDGEVRGAGKTWPPIPALPFSPWSGRAPIGWRHPWDESRLSLVKAGQTVDGCPGSVGSAGFPAHVSE